MSKYCPFRRPTFWVLALIFQLLIQTAAMALECGNSRFQDAVYGSMKEAAEAACVHQSGSTGVMEVNYLSATSAQVRCESCRSDGSCEFWMGWSASCRATEYYADFSDPDIEDQTNGESCPSSNNPINLISGNKYKIHTDIKSNLGETLLSRPGFTRTYNSQVFKHGYNAIGMNWRHSYQRSLQSQDSFNSGINQAETSGGVIFKLTESSIYSSEYAACVEGFEEYKSRIANSGTAKNILQNGTVRWERQSCRIYLTGRYIATIPIRGHASGGVTDYLPPVTLHAIRLSRENGRIYHFVKDYSDQGSIVWKSSEPNMNHNLEQIILDDLTEDELNSPYFQAMQVDSEFRYTDENNVVETYNNEGELISIQYPNGIIETLNYRTIDDAGTVLRLLTNVINNFGKFVNLYYDNDYRIESVRDDTGRSWNYSYDSSGNLVRVDNPDSTSKQYHYENIEYPNLLTGETDERGIRYSTFIYQDDGRAVVSYLGAPRSILNNQIERVDVDYGGGRNNSVTDSLGNTTRYHFPRNSIQGRIVKVDGPECHFCSEPDAEYEYSADYKEWEFYPYPVYLLSKNEFGTGTEYAEYDEKGNPGLITEAVGTEQERQKRLTYDSRYQSNIETITEASVYSAGEKITTYTYDDHDNVTSTQITGFNLQGLPVSREIFMQYNGPFNQISQFDGPRDDVSDITYFDYYPDEAGLGNNRARLRSVRTHSGLYLRDNIQYTATGNIVSENRPNGLHIGYSYYSGSDLIDTVQMTDAFTGEVRSIRYGYLATGDLESITHAYNSDNPVTLTFEYDNARRLTRVIDAHDNYIEYVLDTEGNILEENTYDNSGILKKSLSQTFDSYNRLESSTQLNENRVIDFNPDGTVASVTDGKGVVNEYDYDSLKRLVKYTQDKDGSNPQTANALTEYAYDVQDNLISVKAANDAETTYVYDDLGNLLSRTSPDTGTVNYHHDAAGNIVQSIDAKGVTFFYSYDSSNRLLSIDAPGEEDDIYLVYDTCIQGEGKLCQITRDKSTLNYRYNAFSDVVGIDQSLTTWQGYNTANNTVDYDYDAVGRVSTIKYPSGTIINYAYNAAGKVDNVHMEKDGVITNLSLNISYLPFGKEAIQTYGNGISVMGFYDQAYRPFIVGDPAFYFEYISAYDENGNIKNLMTLDESLYMNSIFDYDEHQRLLSSAGFHGQFNYSYDKAGNKQTQVDNGLETVFTYSVNSNRLAELNSEATNMDENGNITSLRGMIFTYTIDNRLKTTNTGAAYEYNGLGQRSIKHTIAPGVAGDYNYSQSNSFIYGLNGELLAEIGPGGSVKKEYVYLNNQLLAMLERIPSSNEPILNADIDNDGEISVEDFLIWYFNHQTDPAYEVTGDGIAGSDDINAVINCALNQGGCIASSYSTEIYYVHNDHLGTPKMLTNSSGHPVWRATATPFGKASVDNDVDGDGVTIEFNLRQPGQYYDRETGLYYNYYRYYDPETGRYITADPLGELPGVNPAQNLSKSVITKYFSLSTQEIVLGGLNHSYAYVENNPLSFIDPLGLYGQNWLGIPSIAWPYVSEEAPHALNAMRDGAAIGMTINLSLVSGAGLVRLAPEAMCSAYNPAVQQGVMDFTTSLMIPGAPEASLAGFLGGTIGYYTAPEELLR